MLGVCRSSREPGGLRRCPSHARSGLEASAANVAVLERAAAEYLGDSLRRVGIRLADPVGTPEFPVITQRAGDLTAWGFTVDEQRRLSTNHFLDEEVEDFMGSLSDLEECALICYLSVRSGEMNRSITGDEPPPVEDVWREHAQSVVDVLQRWSEYAKENRLASVVVRGVPVAPGWEMKELLDVAYPVGARVETGRITSTTLSSRHAAGFAGDDGYLLVIQSRCGLPVQSLAIWDFENETLLGPGHYLRCVAVEDVGVEGRPTVYLIDEDSVGDEQDWSQ